MFVVDINTLPGGIYFTHVLCNTYKKSTISLLEESRSLKCYDIERFCNVVLKELGRSHSEPSRCTVSAKDEHGLHTEHLGLSAELSRLAGKPVSFKQPRQLDPSSDIIIRGFRLKYLNNKELEQVRHCAGKGAQFLPPFKLVSDNHLWFYFFHKYRNELDEYLGPKEAEWFMSRIPPTYKVAYDGKRFVAQPGNEVSVEFEITDSTIRDFVLKGCTSTGGRKVTVVERAGGQNTRSKALSELKESLNNKSTYILQECITPSKSTNYGFSPQGEIGWITLPTKYSAFYCAGQFMGGIAVLQGSHKIQGSLLSTNAPIFWQQEDTKDIT